MREARRMSIVQLARLSGVAARTISRIERGEEVRFDAIVRLAITFKQPVEQWLALAGLTVPEAQIARIRSRQQSENVEQSFQSLSVDAYSDLLEAQMGENVQAVMTVLIHSRMPIRGEDAKARTQRLLDKGMRFGMVVPFPAIETPHINEVLKGYYANTFAHAIVLTQQLRNMVPADNSNQIRLFRPISTRGMLVNPPASLHELRPCLTRFSSSTAAPQHQLSFYVRFPNNTKPDEWTAINPSVGLGEERIRAEELVILWMAYFAEIQTAWEIGAHVKDDRIKWTSNNQNWEEVE